MALRDLPYLPLYVQDFMTDEKLIECSPAANGIYIRLMCIFHKSAEYGTILLKQKDKSGGSEIENFAIKLSRFMPWPAEDIKHGLAELIKEDVIQINGDKISQKRMIADNALSETRSKAGKEGANKKYFATGKKEEFAIAKTLANTEDENEYENDNELKNKNKEESEGKKGKGKIWSDTVITFYSKLLPLFDVEYHPKTASTTDRWLDTIDKLIRIDKRTPDQIYQLIKKVRADRFWNQNFRSVCKLRDKDKDDIQYLVVFEKKFNGIPRTATPNQNIHDFMDRKAQEILDKYGPDKPVIQKQNGK